MTTETIWNRFARELNESGMTYAEIAELVGLAPSTVGDLANNRYKVPGYEAACRLKDLHVQRCATPRDNNRTS